MNHPVSLHRVEIDLRPWRVAVLALAGVAAVELVLLVLAGGVLLVKPDNPPKKPTRATSSAHSVATIKAATPAAVAELPRRKIGVVVLNGSGRQGAAGRLASSAQRRGYRIRGIANAPDASYPQSIVMYRPGFAGEGRRLAKDLGIGVVGPLDGMRPSQLHGAHAVLILGG